MIPVQKLPFSFDAESLKADVQVFRAEEWTPHFNTQYYEGDWSGLALRAAADGYVALYPDPTATSFEDTDSLRRCTYVPRVLDEFKCQLESVRFLRLGAGASIREHRDHRLSLEDGVARVHIPVVTNSQVEFFLDGQLVEMLAGEAWYLNFNLHHRVENKSSHDRVHLVIDCIVNEWFLSLFCNCSDDKFGTLDERILTEELKEDYTS